ncbi:MAG: DUF5716 family protein [Lachnospiraceae bacterium]|nr:DUF5716 family protein [Lachnospiraceae bacterium]
MFEKPEFIDRINRENRGGGLLLGIDLSRSYAQISLCPGEGLSPVSVKSRPKGEIYAFPALLALYRNRYYAGYDAETIVQLPEAVSFENVFALAMEQDVVTVGGRSYETWELLHHFLRLSLQLVQGYGRADRAGAVMFTTYLPQDPVKQERAYKILARATAQLFGKKTRMYLQSRQESLFHFFLNDQEKLWRGNALIFDYQKEGITGWYCTVEGNTAPWSVHFTELVPERMPKPGPVEERNQHGQEMDGAFYEILRKLGEKPYSLTWLLGDGFKGDWAVQSLDILLDNGRVFQGNNVYSQGACLTLLQMEDGEEAASDYLLLNDTDIRYHIGLNCRRQGLLTENLAEEYVPVFQAGTHVGRCHDRIYVLPQKDEDLIVLAQGARDGVIRRLRVPTGELADGPLGENRLLVEFDFLNISTLRIQVTDAGLGSLLPGSGRTVTETFTLE